MGRDVVANQLKLIVQLGLSVAPAINEADFVRELGLTWNIGQDSKG